MRVYASMKHVEYECIFVWGLHLPTKVLILAVCSGISQELECGSGKSLLVGIDGPAIHHMHSQRLGTEER